MHIKLERKRLRVNAKELMVKEVRKYKEKLLRNLSEIEELTDREKILDQEYDSIMKEIVTLNELCIVECLSKETIEKHIAFIEDTELMTAQEVATQTDGIKPKLVIKPVEPAVTA